ncbi:YgaP family membrane protein [Rhodanobacter terrae]|uniref:DUF2892 domain-containing protein n=1 Tax=Rhodanobacter terrae TaxID=418647 RepID=A0ABW0SZY3_9GAMM
MNVDRIVLGFAGTVVLVGIALAHFVAPAWIWLPVLVGANLLQSAFTGFCPLAMLLRKLGLKPGCAFPS